MGKTSENEKGLMRNTRASTSNCSVRELYTGPTTFLAKRGALHKAFTRRSFCTGEPLHREALTHRSFYTQEFLHQKAFTQKILHRNFDFDTQTRLHRGGKTFTQRSLDTERPVHTEAFTERSLYTEKSWHTGAFTQRTPYTEEIYTQKLLHTDTFTLTHRRFYK